MKKIAFTLILIVVMVSSLALFACDKEPNTTPTAPEFSKTYSITYELNGGTNTSGNPTSFTASTETIKFENPTYMVNGLEAFHFMGWYDNAEFQGKKITELAKGSINDRKYYAKWKAVDYTLTYETNGGINAMENPESYNYTTATFDLGTPIKSGYKFLGWYTDAEFETIPVVTIAEGSVGAYELFARWGMLYAITYELDGGTLDNAIVEYCAEETPTGLPTPTKDGYEFDGWYVSSTFNGEALTEIPEGAVGNLTFYAKWN